MKKNRLKNVLSVLLALLLISCIFTGCNQKESETEIKTEMVKLSSFSAVGSATIKQAESSDYLPVGVGEDFAPDCDKSFIIRFTSQSSADRIEIDKNIIKAGTYLTFDYYYERSCTPTFLGIYLLRLKGVADKNNFSSIAKYNCQVRQFGPDGEFVNGTFDNTSGTINGNLKGNYLTVEVYFSDAPTENLRFACAWLNNGQYANFYITNLRLSEQSLMN